jgi:hypothetical protein
MTKQRATRKFGNSHYLRGKESGFHDCCIVYFLIRGWLTDIEWVGRLYYKYIYFRSPGGHITCPYHTILAMFKVPKYVACEECNNHMLKRNIKTCRVCGGTRLKDTGDVSGTFVNIEGS